MQNKIEEGTNQPQFYFIDRGATRQTGWKSDKIEAVHSSRGAPGFVTSGTRTRPCSAWRGFSELMDRRGRRREGVWMCWSSFWCWLCEARPDQVLGSTLLIIADIQAYYFFVVERGRLESTGMHNIVPEFFWLHGSANFTLKLKRIRSKDKAEADDFSQPDLTRTCNWRRLSSKSWARWVVEISS